MQQNAAGSDSTAVQLAEKVVELMPALRDHIENTHAFFQVGGWKEGRLGKRG